MLEDGLQALLLQICDGPYSCILVPPNAIFWLACITTAQITNVPDSDSDQVPGVLVHGLLRVNIVNW